MSTSGTAVLNRDKKHRSRSEVRSAGRKKYKSWKLIKIVFPIGFGYGYGIYDPVCVFLC